MDGLLEERFAEGILAFEFVIYQVNIIWLLDVKIEA